MSVQGGLTMDSAVLQEQRGPVLWLTINRPEKRNAINGDVVAGLRAGLRAAHGAAHAAASAGSGSGSQASDTPNAPHTPIRAIVITGAGEKAFCAGGDLQPGAGLQFNHAHPNVEYADLLREAQAATIPIVARVNGACMAGGIGLLCLADLAVAADHAVFGLPEVKVGLFPMQVLSLLQRTVPRRTVREWVLTGEPFSAAEAMHAGLLNHVVPAAELDTKVNWLVGRLVDKSPTALRRGKYAMRAIESMAFDEAIAFTEGQIGLLAMTEDAREGLAAFNEKRKPVWTGR